MADISINPEAAKEVVHKAILELLDADARERLIGEAVTALTVRPKKERFSDVEQPSQLEQAFRNAVSQISVQVVREYLEDEVVAQSIRDQILAVLKQLIEDKGTWLYDEIGFAVGKKITEVLTEKRDTW
jgi:hypothetical protein